MTPTVTLVKPNDIDSVSYTNCLISMDLSPRNGLGLEAKNYGLEAKNYGLGLGLVASGLGLVDAVASASNVWCRGLIVL